MAEANTQRSDMCAHAGCKCTVPAGTQYCSDHCAQAARGTPGGAAHGGQCGCGHPACK
jgi:hypothetical protein